MIFLIKIGGGNGPSKPKQQAVNTSTVLIPSVTYTEDKKSGIAASSPLFFLKRIFFANNPDYFDWIYQDFYRR
jgi:hypothetical protein